MIRLASQPQMPPTMSQMIIAMSVFPPVLLIAQREWTIIAAPQTRDAPRLFRIRKGLARILVNLRAGTGGKAGSMLFSNDFQWAALSSAADARTGRDTA